MTKTVRDNLTLTPMSEHPPLIARGRFFIRRFFLAVHLVVSASIAVPAAHILVSKVRSVEGITAQLMVTQFALCILVALVAAGPLLSSLTRPARRSDFAAAFDAADEFERPRLREKIEARLSSKIHSNPMSVKDLALAFSIVRSEHGKRARWAAAKAAKSIDEQQQFLQIKAPE